MKKNIFSRFINCFKYSKKSKFDHLLKIYDTEEIINIITNFSNIDRKKLINLNTCELGKIWCEYNIDEKIDYITK